MFKFLESHIGQIIARNGILAIILAWALWKNDRLTERLFVVIQNNTELMSQIRDIITRGEMSYGRN